MMFQSETPRMFALSAFLFLSIVSFKNANALSQQHQNNHNRNDVRKELRVRAYAHVVKRRTIIDGIIASSSLSTAALLPIAFQPKSAEAGMPPTLGSGGPGPGPGPPGGIQGVGGMTTRVEGIGGGFDITTSTTTRGVDAIYPSSMAGSWKCRRIVTSVEGDAGQAEVAWRALGGTGDLRKMESFQTTFVLPPGEDDDSVYSVKNKYMFDGQTYSGVVLDRGQEMLSRISSPAGTLGKATWSIELPDILHYEREDGKDIEVAVVQRKVELPSEKGFGFTELYRVTSYAGGIFAENKVQRAIRVARRYRRALDQNGNRIVEGLEIMKTYRVLDGIAGVEMPTSTTKSQLQLSRPEMT